MSINRFVSVRIDRFADFSDTPITNQQIATHDGIVGIHRHNSAVLDEN